MTKYYTVEVPNAKSNILHKNIRTGKYLFHSGNGLRGYTNRLTECEINNFFPWARQFAEPVGEVE